MALVKEIFSFNPLPNHTPSLYSPPPWVFFCSPLPWKNFFAPPPLLKFQRRPCVIPPPRKRKSRSDCCAVNCGRTCGADLVTINYLLERGGGGPLRAPLTARKRAFYSGPELIRSLYFVSSSLLIYHTACCFLSAAKPRPWNCQSCCCCCWDDFQFWYFFQDRDIFIK